MSYLTMLRDFHQILKGIAGNDDHGFGQMVTVIVGDASGSRQR